MARCEIQPQSQWDAASKFTRIKIFIRAIIINSEYLWVIKINTKLILVVIIQDVLTSNFKWNVNYQKKEEDNFVSPNFIHHSSSFYSFQSQHWYFIKSLCRCTLFSVLNIFVYLRICTILFLFICININCYLLVFLVNLCRPLNRNISFILFLFTIISLILFPTILQMLMLF